MILTSTRLILRHFQEGDEQALFDLLSDKEVNTFLPMFPLQNLDEAKHYLKEHYLDKYQKNLGYYYAICLKENNLPIGYIQMSESASHDFGYALRKEYWHQGIMSEAAAIFMERLKQEGVSFITATHDVVNINSGKVMQKIGMTYQYSYTERWMPKDKDVTFRMYQLNFKKPQDWVYLEYWNKYPHFVEEL
ncbi:GNAT family N-acetyltransferase [Longibaculum muris]|uniref:GNAT family N-acetyltransferase n=1 Tax=Longibaculum muris TaxID=1796628 RepID=UPI0022E6BA0B|nr:GNAT family N-acetyltransferase [Longibaculum muris]